MPWWKTHQFDRNQIRTVNINQGSFLRYSFRILMQKFRATHQGRPWESEFSKPEIPCYEHRFKHLSFCYRYPISYKNAKRQILLNGFALIEKRYHRFWIIFKNKDILQKSKDWSRLWYRIMLSQKIRALDTWTLFQILKILPTFAYWKLLEDKNRSDLYDHH